MKSLNIEEMTTTYGGSASTYRNGERTGTSARHWLEKARLTYLVDRFLISLF
jgi:hypothetical protein